MWSQTKWHMNSWLSNNSRGRQPLYLDTKFICLFESCAGVKTSNIYAVPLGEKLDSLVHMDTNWSNWVKLKTSTSLRAQAELSL